MNACLSRLALERLISFQRTHLVLLFTIRSLVRSFVLKESVQPTLKKTKKIRFRFSIDHYGKNDFVNHKKETSFIPSSKERECVCTLNELFAAALSRDEMRWGRERFYDLVRFDDRWLMTRPSRTGLGRLDRYYTARFIRLSKQAVRSMLLWLLDSYPLQKLKYGSNKDRFIWNLNNNSSP